MESEPKAEANPAPPKLHLTSLPTLKPSHNHTHSTSLPPFRTSASIPFSWELEPGIPLPCLTLVLASSPGNLIKTLELPPRLVNKFAKTPSQTSVLEGPYCSLKLLIRNNSEKTDKGLFGSWRKGKEKSCRSVGHEGSFVFSSCLDDGISNGSYSDGVPRKRSQLRLSLAKSQFLATMYGTVKQVIPRSTKCKKDAS